MQLGVFAKTFPGATPAAVLSAARRAGYQTVQYNMACSGLGPLPPSITPESAAAVHAASAETGVAIAAVSATYNMIHPNPAERAKGRQAFQAIAAAAHRMGTRLLTVCTGTCDPHDPWKYHPANSSAAAWEELCNEFHLLLALAEQHNLLIGVEPELNNVVSSASRARQLLDTFNNPRIRIVLDGANLFHVADAATQRSLIDNAIDLLGNSIALAHAKDRLLDYPHYLFALHKSGFRGSLIAHGIAAHQAEAVALFLQNQLSALEADSR